MRAIEAQEGERRHGGPEEVALDVVEHGLALREHQHAVARAARALLAQPAVAQQLPVAPRAALRPWLVPRRDSLPERHKLRRHSDVAQGNLQRAALSARLRLRPRPVSAAHASERAAEAGSAPRAARSRGA